MEMVAAMRESSGVLGLMVRARLNLKALVHAPANGFTESITGVDASKAYLTSQALSTMGNSAMGSVRAWEDFSAFRMV